MTVKPESLIERVLADLTGFGDDGANAEILDAASALFADQGIQRTTMEDVAGRAGLSRITIYRRMTSKEALVEQVMLREFRRYIGQFIIDIGSARTAEDRVVAGFVSALSAFGSNPLFLKLSMAASETIEPLPFDDPGSLLEVVTGFVAGQLRREQEGGHIGTQVDVDVVAELMVRVAASIALAPSQRIGLDDADHLAEIARRYLVPMLGPSDD